MNAGERPFRVLLTSILAATVGSAASHAHAWSGSQGQERQAAIASPKLRAYSQVLGSRAITLHEAVDVGLNLSPELAAAAASLAYAQGHVGEARSAFMPTVSIGPGAEYVTHLATPVYTIQATLPLDISHLIATATDQAKYQEIGARLNINRVRNETVFRIESTFYGALRSQALVDVAAENLANSQERLRDSEARYKARAVAYIDVVRAQTDVADAQRQLIQAKSSVTASLGLLARAMGIDPSEPPHISDDAAVVLPPGVSMPTDSPIPSPDQLPPITPPTKVLELGPLPQRSMTAEPTDLGSDFTSTLASALDNRPEVMEGNAEISAARKGVYLARRSDLPSISLGLGYFDLRTSSGSRVNEPQAYLGVTIPLYDGGLARARVDEAKAVVAAAETAQRKTVDAVKLDVQQAFVALIQARDEVIASVQGVVKARVAFNLAKVRYDTGVASHAGISPLLELSDAQAALTLAEQNQVNALYDYNSARAQVDRSAGRFAYSEATKLMK